MGILLIPFVMSSGQEIPTTEEKLAKCRREGSVIVGEFQQIYDLDPAILEAGFCNHFGDWIPAIPTIPSYNNFPPNIDEHGNKIIYVGGATHYNPTVIEEAATNLGIDLSVCFDGTAVMFGKPIGQPFPYSFVWARVIGGDPNWLKLCVADSVSREDAFYHIDKRYLGNALEVGALTAQEWGMIVITPDGKEVAERTLYQVEVEVYFGDEPPAEGEGIRVHYSDWWESTVRFGRNGQVYPYPPPGWGD